MVKKKSERIWYISEILLIFSLLTTKIIFTKKSQKFTKKDCSTESVFTFHRDSKENNCVHFLPNILFCT